MTLGDQIKFNCLSRLLEDCSARLIEVKQNFSLHWVTDEVLNPADSNKPASLGYRFLTRQHHELPQSNLHICSPFDENK